MLNTFILQLLAICVINHGSRTQETQEDFLHQQVVCRQKYSDPARRVLGGSDVRSSEFPWVVRVETPVVMVEGSKAWDDLYICTGSLILSQYVLTAAHCFTRHQLRGIPKVLMGSNENFRLKRHLAHLFRIHPFYFSPLRLHDIAVLKLDEEIRAFNEFLSPVCLPPMYSSFVSPGSKVVITGWGQDDKGRPVPDTLQKTEVTVVNEEACRWFYPQISDEICTHSLLTHTCAGDSGGPLMLADGDTQFVVGIVSYGQSSSCTFKILPTVFTRVGKYVEWILQVVRELGDVSLKNTDQLFN